MRKNISPQKALVYIKNNSFDNKKYKVIFSTDKIDAFDVILFEKNGVDVPRELIVYDDSKIDFSDIPELSENDIENNRLIPTISAEIPLDEEIRDWIKKENIDIGEFTAKLIRSFYKHMKSLPKNAAL